MALLTTREELAQVREQIQSISSEAQVSQVSLGGDAQISYASRRLDLLQAREKVLMARLSMRNVRKRSQIRFH